MSTSNPDIEAMLDNIDLGDSWRKLAASTTDKEYRKIVAYDNCTSYSQMGDLHACPRRYQLIKSDAKQPSVSDNGGLQSNLDFAFGHSVGAGIQTLIATGSLERGLFAAFISWKADYFADADEINRGYGRTSRKHKSLAYAQFAVEKFHAQGLAEEWEIYTLPSGKPGVEISFAVDLETENKGKHYGHIDLILRHKRLGTIAVWELKTDGFVDIDDAKYANSSQALGYGVILDHIEPSLAEYDVVYAVYSTPSLEWHVLPFTKSLTQKAEWLADTLLDHSAVNTYRKMNFFPKRGESCISRYGYRCKYFGICDLTAHVTYTDLPEGMDAEKVDVTVTKTEIINTQRFRAQEL